MSHYRTTFWTSGRFRAAHDRGRGGRRNLRCSGKHRRRSVAAAGELMLRLDLASGFLLVRYSLARNGLANVILARDFLCGIRGPRLAGVVEGVGGVDGRECRLGARLLAEGSPQARV